MINAFINSEPLLFLASNFEKLTEYCNHPTVASIRITVAAKLQNSVNLFRTIFKELHSSLDVIDVQDNEAQRYTCYFLLHVLFTLARVIFTCMRI